MKDCRKVHPLLSLYQEGELSAREKGLVEKHVSGCPVARAELERLEHLHRTLRKLPEPNIPRDLHDKIMARLGRKTERKRKVLWFNPTWVLTAAAAALALIVLTQYPRWTTGHNENLAFNKTAPAPSAPSPSKDGSAISDYSIGANEQPSMENKPMVMAAKRKVSKKKVIVSSNGTTTIVMKLERPINKSAPNIGIVRDIAQPTMVVALGIPASKEYAEEPKRAKKNLNENLSIPQSGSPQVDFRANVQAALPPASADAAAPTVQYKAVDQLANAQFGATLQQPQTFWSGSYSPVTVENQELITDSATFQVEWNKVQPNQPLPPVDFTTQAVILLNAGNQPTTGYAIQVSRLEETTDQLLVHYQIIAPPLGAVTGQIVTRPWAMQVILKPVKSVTFLEN